MSKITGIYSYWKLVIRDKAGVIRQLRDQASGQVKR
jgi:hypothetical protein